MRLKGNPKLARDDCVNIMALLDRLDTEHRRFMRENPAFAAIFDSPDLTFTDRLGMSTTMTSPQDDQSSDVPAWLPLTVELFNQQMQLAKQLAQLRLDEANGRHPAEIWEALANLNAESERIDHECQEMDKIYGPQTSPTKVAIFCCLALISVYLIGFIYTLIVCAVLDVWRVYFPFKSEEMVSQSLELHDSGSRLRRRERAGKFRRSVLCLERVGP